MISILAKKLLQDITKRASKVDGAEVVVKRVPETMPPQLFEKAGGKTQTAPVATPQELADYDAIIFGTPTRFGNMSGQMRTFLDQTGGLWASGALYGKLASVFSSTGTGGGQEQTITSTWTTLAHHGMVIVPIGYAAQELFTRLTTTSAPSTLLAPSATARAIVSICPYME